MSPLPGEKQKQDVVQTVPRESQASSNTSVDSPSNSVVASFAGPVPEFKPVVSKKNARTQLLKEKRAKHALALEAQDARALEDPETPLTVPSAPPSACLTHVLTGKSVREVRKWEHTSDCPNALGDGWTLAPRLHRATEWLSGFLPIPTRPRLTLTPGRVLRFRPIVYMPMFAVLVAVMLGISKIPVPSVTTMVAAALPSTATDGHFRFHLPSIASLTGGGPLRTTTVVVRRTKDLNEQFYDFLSKTFVTAMEHPLPILGAPIDFEDSFVNNWSKNLYIKSLKRYPSYINLAYGPTGTRWYDKVLSAARFVLHPSELVTRGLDESAFTQEYYFVPHFWFYVAVSYCATSLVVILYSAIRSKIHCYVTYEYLGPFQSKGAALLDNTHASIVATTLVLYRKTEYRTRVSLAGWFQRTMVSYVVADDQLISSLVEKSSPLPKSPERTTALRNYANYSGGKLKWDDSVSHAYAYFNGERVQVTGTVKENCVEVVEKFQDRILAEKKEAADFLCQPLF